jgi:hypothetical protein
MGRIWGILGTVIVIVVGLFTLFGLTTQGPFFGTLADLLLQIVTITIAVTVLIGIFNLLTVHLRRVRGRSRGWGYSLVLVISLLAVILLTLLERANVLTSEPALTTILLEQVQVSIESALASLLLFALVYGAYRVLRKRVSGWGFIFVLAILLVLAGALPLPELAQVQALRDWLMAVPVSAGARGILLGIALATVVTGLRVLIGQDRSYRE